MKSGITSYFVELAFQQKVFFVRRYLTSSTFNVFFEGYYVGAAS